MEEFLSIVVLLLWIIISIYNKNKKKKQQTVSKQPVQEQENQGTVSRKPKSILEQILLGEEPETTSYDYEEKPAGIDLSDEVEEEGMLKVAAGDKQQKAKYDFDPKKEAVSSGLKVLLEDDTLDDYDDENAIEFDLKQAVIYSEILKRPYAN